MKQNFQVVNGILGEMNRALESGGIVKSITAIPEPVCYTGTGFRESDSDGYHAGYIYIYSY